MQASTPLGLEETYGELSVRLSVLGADLFMKTLAALEAGTLQRHPQEEERATYCKMLTRDTGKLSMDMSAMQIHNLVRGTDPWPGAYAILGEEKLKIWKTLWGSPKDGLVLQCGDGVLMLQELQAPGGKRMNGNAFLRGHDITGSILR